MATRTFLELVNDVLLEMREPVVTTWNSTDYSTLIGRFVNVAKRSVENAWTWHTLRQNFVVTTAAGTTRYTLTGAHARFRILHTDDAYNKTNKFALYELNRSAHRALFYGDFTDTSGLPTGLVEGFSYVEAESGGYRQIDVWPVPNSVQSLRFHGYNPQEDWTADGDVCYIPYRGIVQTAIALARGERGEDGGIATSEAAGFALAASGDDIALDASRDPEDVTWEAV